MHILTKHQLNMHKRNVCGTAERNLNDVIQLHCAEVHFCILVKTKGACASCHRSVCCFTHCPFHVLQLRTHQTLHSDKSHQVQ